jgi:hypothetical protein
MKTIMLITISVTTEIASRRTRNSTTAGALAGQFQDVPFTRMRPSGTAL